MQLLFRSLSYEGVTTFFVLARLICQAVPNHDPAGQNVETAIQEAIVEAEAAGIQGRDITPFILRAVAEKTGGDSLRRCVFLSESDFCLFE
jgi:pseudouridine-5'-phosphate glycosidase